LREVFRDLHVAPGDGHLGVGAEDLVAVSRCRHLLPTSRYGHRPSVSGITHGVHGDGTNCNSRIQTRLPPRPRPRAFRRSRKASFTTAPVRGISPRRGGDRGRRPRVRDGRCWVAVDPGLTFRWPRVPASLTPGSGPVHALANTRTRSARTPSDA